ncbi:MAG: YaeQ family protein [Mariprofundaceae bacterium]|nr:YaeQ family protein [Mariprofundaceae bacterium]
MALKSTILKATIQITDMDRNYYQDHHLTIAQHPSESDMRLMVRLLAFALHASESMQLTKGLSTDDEPDIWQKNLSDGIEVWIDLGHPDEKRVRKACGRAQQVIIYTYQHRSSQVWWKQQKNKFNRFKNLSVRHIDETSAQGLAHMAARSMQLQCTIQDGQCWFSNGEEALEITPIMCKEGQS